MMANHRELLRKVSIFAALSDKELDVLAAGTVERSFEKDALIVGAEDPGDALFIIGAGKVKVVLYGESGREVILSVLKEGDFFGEMSLLDNQPRSANVRAIEPTRALVLSRDAFHQVLRGGPQMAIPILAELSRRLRRADESIGNLALLDVYGRVARFLLDLGKHDGVQREDGLEIRERPTQQHIAAMVGTSRETVSRALNEFQRRGLIEMDGKYILLKPGFEVEGAGQD
ncbi:MAG: Crp/Fnr family transcriptional regulator [Deltaproteobacteria bacterium]|nr:Crp/Fnr family transcriptional regulator [Deltaproteobacteria bacterium]